MNTRRQFLLQAPIGMLAAAACRGDTPTPEATSIKIVIE